MNGKGVQNAQMQGPQSSMGGNQETAACWWTIYAEGDPGRDGLSRF